LANSDYLPLFVAMTSRNGLQYRHSDFKKFICDDLASSNLAKLTFAIFQMLGLRVM